VDKKQLAEALTGKDEQISAMLSPTMKEKKQTSTQPHTMTTGPPLFFPVPNWVVMPVRMDMMEKDTAKLVKRFCEEKEENI
jgi:hypothetical protein